jgi:hypothetical protein
MVWRDGGGGAIQAASPQATSFPACIPRAPHSIPSASDPVVRARPAMYYRDRLTFWLFILACMGVAAFLTTWWGTIAVGIAVAIALIYWMRRSSK